MSKNITIFLLAATMISMVIAADATCKSHPAFTKAKTLVSDAIKGDDKGKTKGEKLFKSFENAKTSVRTATDMGVCKDYAGQKTCCDINMAKLIDQAALLKVKPIQQGKNAFHKLVVAYNNQLNKKCQKANVVTASVDQIFSNTKLTQFQKLRDTQKQCKVSFGKAMAAFNRGVMCTMCAGIEKVNDYFQNNQLKISPESVAAFQKATDDAVTCISGIFTTTNLDNILTELNDNYIKNGDTCAADIATKIKTVFSDPKVKNDTGSGKKCKGTTVFAANPDCENVLQGASDLEDKGSARFLGVDEEMNRLLQAAEDAVSVAGGVNVYVTSDTDNSVDEFGNINGNFDSIKASAFKIGVSAILALFVLLF